jgi:hypothetical protein
MAIEVFGLTRENKREECSKRLHHNRSDGNIQKYKEASRNTNKVVSEERGQTYAELYWKLNTKESKNDVYKMDKLRVRKTKDFDQVKCIKDEIDRFLVKDDEIKNIWREYFDKLFNDESEKTVIELDDSVDDTNMRFVRRIQESEVKET